jgi:hypothetical protein
MPLDLEAIRAGKWTTREVHAMIAELTAARAGIARLREALTPLAAAFDGYTIEVRSERRRETSDDECPVLEVHVDELRGTVRKHVRDALDRARAALEGQP